MNTELEQKIAKHLRLLKDNGIKHPNCSELARIYGVDRRTIKRLLDHDGTPVRKKRQKFSRWDPYTDLIEQKLQIKGSTIRGVYRYLNDNLPSGAPATYESLKAFIRKKGLQTGKKAARTP